VWKFLIDEDMPRSTAVALRQAGHAALDVRDIGLRGHGDREIFQYAQAQDAILLTGDKGFSNIVRFPLGTHAGILVIRVPNELPTQTVNDEVLRALEDLEGEDLAGLLMIVEVGRTRVRRPGRLGPQS
jgi:predicted nuclease of predicted toxin-antitoxin system